jgi:hypothetical protein
MSVDPQGLSPGHSGKAKHDWESACGGHACAVPPATAAKLPAKLLPAHAGALRGSAFEVLAERAISGGFVELGAVDGVMALRRTATATEALMQESSGPSRLDDNGAGTIRRGIDY